MSSTTTSATSIHKVRRDARGGKRGDGDRRHQRIRRADPTRIHAGKPDATLTGVAGLASFGVFCREQGIDAELERLFFRLKSSPLVVYPMEAQAMRSLNFLGNKFFSLAFSWLLGQPIKDTLCGTKVLWKKDYELIAANRSYFGDFDPFGDFDLIFGAAKQNLKIVDLPIRYRERTYGSTNISRWKHGLLLMRMVAFAARRIKFV